MGLAIVTCPSCAQFHIASLFSRKLTNQFALLHQQVHFEPKDKISKRSAKSAFRQLFKQNKVFNTAKKASFVIAAVYQLKLVE
jgi:hypothetical protein